MTDGPSEPPVPPTTSRSFPPLDRQTLLVILGFVVLLGTHLRFHALDLQSLWLDELASVEVASHGSLGAVATEALRHDVHPPLYFLLLHVAMQAFGDSEFALRALSAAAGALAIPLIFLLGRKLYDNETGLVAAMLTAVLWFPVYYSQEARPYSLLMLLTLASVYGWVVVMEGLTRDGRVRLGPAALYAAAALACAYTHYFGVLLVAIEGAAAAAWLAARRPRALGRLAAIFGVIALGYAPWFSDALRTARSSAGWIPMPNARLLVACFRWFFNRSTVVVACALALYAWLLVRDLRDAFAPGAPKDGKGASSAFKDLVLALWLTVPFAAATAISLVRTPIVWPRFFVICAPAAYLLAARGIVRLPLRGNARAVTTGALGALLLMHLFVFERYYADPHKEQFREAVGLVASNDKAYPDSLIIASGAAPQFFDIYFERLGSSRRVDVPTVTPAQVADVPRRVAERKARYVWLLYAHKAPDPALLEYLQRNFTAREAKPLYQAGVLLLENRPPPGR